MRARRSDDSPTCSGFAVGSSLAPTGATVTNERTRASTMESRFMTHLPLSGGISDTSDELPKILEDIGGRGVPARPRPDWGTVRPAGAHSHGADGLRFRGGPGGVAGRGAF